MIRQPMNRSNKAEPLEGIIPPLVTPLLNYDQLDVHGLERLLQHVLEGGVHGLFILGTSGEGPSLSYRLRRELITRTCQFTAGRVPVLVGITDTSLAESIALARHAAEAGARAVVSSTPYYFSPTQQELLALVRQSVRELPLPLYLYNMPMLTKTQFEPKTVAELAQLERIVGLKDSSGDLNYFKEIVRVAQARPDWRLFVGPEHLLVESMRMGGHGGVNGGSQVHPRLLVGLYEAVRKDDRSSLTSLQQRLAVLGKIYLDGRYASSVILGMKCALSLLGICGAQAAPPLTSLSPEQRQQVRDALAELNLLPAREPALH